MHSQICITFFVIFFISFFLPLGLGGWGGLGLWLESLAYPIIFGIASQLGSSLNKVHPSGLELTTNFLLSDLSKLFLRLLANLIVEDANPISELAFES